MPGNVVSVGDADFKREVLEAAEPVLVDFTATWCAPCRAITPALEELAGKYQGQVKVVKVDVDDNQVAAQKFNVRSMPTLLMFRDGKVVEQIVGAVPKARIEESFRKVV